MDFIVISTVHKAVVCADADSGVITTISLTGGSVEHTCLAAEYCGMTDLVASEDSVFVATPASGVVVMSVSGSEVSGHLCDPDGPSVPTSMLVNSRRDGQLIVGYRHGLVVIFDVDTETVVCSLRGHSARINTLHLLSTGQLISAADDQRGIIWNDQQPADDVAMETGMWAQWQVRDDVSCYTLDNCRRLVYAGFSSGDVHVYDVDTGQSVSRVIIIILIIIIM